MFKDGKGGAFTLAAAVLAAMIPFGCSNNDGPTQSTAVSGGLEVFFDPNPAPITAYGQYSSFICVGVPSDTGVYIHGAIRQQYSAAGEPYRPETEDEMWFKINFQIDQDEGAYIPGWEARCALFDWEDHDHDRYEDWTFLGEDDFGNEVRGTGRLYLGDVH